MLPETAGRKQHFQDLGHSFSLKGPTSQPIKNTALGSEIKETIQGDLRHHHILLFWRRTLHKMKRDIDSSC